MKDLTKGNIYKTFFLFGLPLVLSGLLSQLYGTIDTAIAGRFLGETGLAAIGATAPLITFVSSIFWGYGVGFGVYIARLFSRGEYAKIKSAVYSTVAMTFCVEIVLAGTLIALHAPLFELLNVEKSLQKAAFEYFAFYMGGLFFITLTSFFVFIMNAFGIGSFPFYMSLISAVLNVGGNVLSVVVFGWGIKGLSIASVIAALVVDVCYFFKFRKCLKEMGVHKERVRLSFDNIKNSLPFALPNMAQQGVMYVATLFISPLINGLGAAASASYSVVSRVYDICAGVYQNSARSVSNYTAQCVGQGKRDKIKKGVFVGLLQGVLFVTPFILACSIFHKPICSLFFKANAGPTAKGYAYLFAKKYLPLLYLNLVCNLFHGLFRGVKSTGYLFSSSLFAAVVRYVASALLITKFGMEGFYVGWVISWAAEAVFATLLFFFGKWNVPSEGEAEFVRAESTEQRETEEETPELSESLTEAESSEEPKTAV